MAAAEVLAFTDTWRGSGGLASISQTIKPCATGLDERWLRARLSLIAKAWVATRTNVEVSGYNILFAATFPSRRFLVRLAGQSLPPTSIARTTATTLRRYHVRVMVWR